MAFDETIIANNNDIDHHDALSFFDLQMDNDENDLESPFFEASPGDVFEFLTTPETKRYRTDDDDDNDDKGIVFCGKSLIPPKHPTNNNNNGRFVRKDDNNLFKKCQSSRAPALSDSFRFGGPKAVSPANGGGGGSYYGRSGSSSRKPSIIGLVMKWEQKMDLSDIRKRQERRAPSPMFRVNGGAGEGDGKSGSGLGHWGLLKQLRCRVHFVDVLTKAASFGCISHA